MKYVQFIVTFLCVFFIITITTGCQPSNNKKNEVENKRKWFNLALIENLENKLDEKFHTDHLRVFLGEADQVISIPECYEKMVKYYQADEMHRQDAIAYANLDMLNVFEDWKDSNNILDDNNVWDKSDDFMRLKMWVYPIEITLYSVGGIPIPTTKKGIYPYHAIYLIDNDKIVSYLCMRYVGLGKNALEEE
ncbi:MAG: hypothetical protein K9M57_05595 [Phycisphaerae bacterium]|nr:hypothetical protein [Phycisphaerae bacterium]